MNDGGGDIQRKSSDKRVVGRCTSPGAVTAKSLDLGDYGSSSDEALPDIKNCRVGKANPDA